MSRLLAMRLGSRFCRVSRPRLSSAASRVIRATPRQRDLPAGSAAAARKPKGR